MLASTGVNLGQAAFGLDSQGEIAGEASPASSSKTMALLPPNAVGVNVSGST